MITDACFAGERVARDAGLELRGIDDVVRDEIRDPATGSATPPAASR